MLRPSPKLLRELFDYEPETGALHWRHRHVSMFSNCGIQPAHYVRDRWNSKNAGKPALTTMLHNGYLFGRLFDRAVRAHHVIWAIMTGEWPTKQIDHLNGIRSDNRWANLRHVEPVENSHNLCRSRRNTSGRVGVARAGRGWQAYINRDRKRVSLGCFATFDEGAEARATAEAQCGYHPNHGRS